MTDILLDSLNVKIAPPSVVTPPPAGEILLAEALVVVPYSPTAPPLDEVFLAGVIVVVPYSPTAPGEVWPCPYNDAVFTTLEELEAHLALVHPEYTPPEEEAISLGWLALGAAMVGGIAIASKKLIKKARS